MIPAVVLVFFFYSVARLFLNVPMAKVVRLYLMFLVAEIGGFMNRSRARTSCV